MTTTSPAARVAGTDHRPQKLGGFSPAVDTRLRDLARSWLSEHRPDEVVSGMALGWDMALAEAVLELGLPLSAAVPFVGQESKWPAPSQKRYRDILARATRVEIVSSGLYSPRLMMVRNE
jgi:uncharacterized phage-like protein YoqJ